MIYGWNSINEGWDLIKDGIRSLIKSSFKTFISKFKKPKEYQPGVPYDPRIVNELITQFSDMLFIRKLQSEARFKPYVDIRNTVSDDETTRTGET